jgi:hypothetical protein
MGAVWRRTPSSAQRVRGVSHPDARRHAVRETHQNFAKSPPGHGCARQHVCGFHRLRPPGTRRRRRLTWKPTPPLRHWAWRSTSWPPPAGMTPSMSQGRRRRRPDRRSNHRSPTRRSDRTFLTGNVQRSNMGGALTMIQIRASLSPIAFATYSTKERTAGATPLREG